MKTSLPLILTLVCVGTSCLAQVEPRYQKDSAGSKDHPVTERIEGSVIFRQTSKKFADLIIPLQRVLFDYSAQAFKPFNKLKPEGGWVGGWVNWVSVWVGG